jgi:hypothetical protein
MSVQGEITVPRPFVHHRLFQRFYKNGKATSDKAASSHWIEFAKKFSVRPVENDFELAGYGFGESSSYGLSAQISAWVGNMFHMTYLAMPDLRQDVRDAKEVVAKMGLAFSADAFRQACTLNFLASQLKSGAPPDRILVIGDGHGILSALLHRRYPAAQIFLADLGSVLFFQAYHLHKAYPDAQQILTDENAAEVGVFGFCPADRLETLPAEPFCLAINVASMQEMDPAVTTNYFTLLRLHNTRLFYCCNRLEKSFMGGGGDVRFMDYPWTPSDVHLVDELCPWHQWFFGRGASPFVRVLGLPIPFMHRYDGPHWHRLTCLGK